MKPATTIIAAFAALATSAAAIGLGAAALEGPPTLMSPVKYERFAGDIRTATRAAIAACRQAADTERDVCRVTARAAGRVMIADLDARYYGTTAARQQAAAARVRAAYEVERARCLAQPGDERLGCLRAARAALTRPPEDARPGGLQGRAAPAGAGSPRTSQAP